MATSIILGGREAGQKRASRRAAAEALVESYCRSMAEFARQPILQVARFHIHREARIQPIHKALLQSQRSTPLDLLEKFTESDGRGRARFRNLRPGSWRVTGQEAKDVLTALSTYRECLGPERKHLFDLFRPVDVGFKVVGTGSVGLRNYMVLCEGNGPKDPLFLQVKQEMKSAYAPYVPNVVYKHQGRRVAEGQRAIQPVSDLLLGWADFGGHEYLVRQLNDHKGSVDIKTLKGSGLESLAVVASMVPEIAVPCMMVWPAKGRASPTPNRWFGTHVKYRQSFVNVVVLRRPRPSLLPRGSGGLHRRHHARRRQGQP
jgi:uncharacterized protein (DUF2252 family)